MHAYIMMLTLTLNFGCLSPNQLTFCMDIAHVAVLSLVICNLLQVENIICNTVESPNEGHFGAAIAVLCKEVVLFGRLKLY